MRHKSCQSVVSINYAPQIMPINLFHQSRTTNHAINHKKHSNGYKSLQPLQRHIYKLGFESLGEIILCSEKNIRRRQHIILGFLYF
ncbi:hypothetical protein Sjap_024070 [Stephania japonica]|uniref:Uncharacterized protein n=1 Tax=Stephania japonica TaxID=461633 RepID=A0AAP0EK28_9MAGN